MEIENPVKMTEETVKKIEEALLMDCTIEQICFNANISKQTYYNWLESVPGLKERFDYLKHNLRYKSKRNIANKIESGDTDISKWYLERRDKDFKPKSDVTTDDKPIAIFNGKSISADNGGKQDIQPEQED